MTNADDIGFEAEELIAGADVVRYPDPSPLDGWWADLVNRRRSSR